jgi:outer membrane lipoprotein-sorting protein
MRSMINRNDRAVVRRILISALILSVGLQAAAMDAAEILAKADESLTGDRVYSLSTMTIYREGRSLPVQKMETYTLTKDGTYMSFSEYVEPERMRGSAFLQIGNDIWVRFATTGRVRKLSSFAKRNATGGSDFSYADMGDGSGGMAQYYRAEITGSERVDGYDCYLLRLEPKEGADDAPYPRLDVYIEKNTFLYRRIDYYEAAAVFKSLHLGDYTESGGRRYPLTAEMRNKVRDSRTVIETQEIEFESPRVKESFFSVEYLESMR